MAEENDTLNTTDYWRLILGVAVLLLAGTNLLTFYAKSGGSQSAAAAASPTPAVLTPSHEDLKDIPVINGHDHLWREQDFKRYLAPAEKLGVTKTLFVASSEFTIKGDKFSPALGNEENSREILRVAKLYPDKIIPFVTFHPDNENKVALLKEYLAEGAKGVKLYTGHGNFHDRPLLSEDMREFYAFCEAEAIPLCWHVNLSKFSGEFTQVLLEYPKLKIILPHFGVGFYTPGGKTMQDLAQILDNYPNVYVDSSFGTRDILVAGLERVSGAVPIFRDFYLRYQDRIIFGTDMVVTGNREKTPAWISSVIRACRDMHEKETYQFWMAADGAPYATNRGNPYGVFKGLNLPEDVLRKVYGENLERLLSKPE